MTLLLNTDCLPRGFASLDSSPGSRVADIQLPAPVLETHCQSIMRDLVGIPLVVYLLLSRGPAAIVFAIPKIVVDSIKGEAFGDRSHVIKKVREGFHPPFANFYSSTSVVFISLRFWNRAALFHRPPALVRWGSRHAMCGVGLNAEATARLYATFLEVIAAHCSRLSAFTSAVPISPGVLRRSADNLEAPINLSGPINISEGHNVLSVGVLC